MSIRFSKMLNCENAIITSLLICKFYIANYKEKEEKRSC